MISQGLLSVVERVWGDLLSLNPIGVLSGDGPLQQPSETASIGKGRNRTYVLQSSLPAEVQH